MAKERGVTDDQRIAEIESLHKQWGKWKVCDHVWMISKIKRDREEIQHLRGSVEFWKQQEAMSKS